MGINDSEVRTGCERLIFLGTCPARSLESECQEVVAEIPKKKMKGLALVTAIIFLIVNYKNIIKLQGYTNAPQAAISLSLLFLFISLADYFFLSYEQFYIIEK